MNLLHSYCKSKLLKFYFELVYIHTFSTYQIGLTSSAFTQLSRIAATVGGGETGGGLVADFTLDVRHRLGGRAGGKEAVSFVDTSRLQKEGERNR